MPSPGTGDAVPPPAAIWYSSRPAPAEKTITPALLHAPPRGSSASPSICGGPASMLILFSLPWAKNPSDLLSGDQNGYAAPSVATSALGEDESIAWSQSSCLPS